jgi:hypothetical protein
VIEDADFGIVVSQTQVVDQIVRRHKLDASYAN